MWRRGNFITGPELNISVYVRKKNRFPVTKSHSRDILSMALLHELQLILKSPASSSFMVLYQRCVCSAEALWRCSVSSSSLLPLLLQQNRATPSTAPPDCWPTARRRFTFTAYTSCSSITPGCGTHVSPTGKTRVLAWAKYFDYHWFTTNKIGFRISDYNKFLQLLRLQGDVHVILTNPPSTCQHYIISLTVLIANPLISRTHSHACQSVSVIRDGFWSVIGPWQIKILRITSCRTHTHTHTTELRVKQSAHFQFVPVVSGGTATK